MPIRIQRKRSKGWKMPPNTVYVGRPTKWGNPFYVIQPGALSAFGACRNNKEAVDKFEHYLKFELFGIDPVANFLNRQFQSLIAPLVGKDLACWCKLDQPCHADILLKLANEGIE